MTGLSLALCTAVFCTICSAMPTGAQGPKRDFSDLWDSLCDEQMIATRRLGRDRGSGGAVVPRRGRAEPAT